MQSNDELNLDCVWRNAKKCFRISAHARKFYDSSDAGSWVWRWYHRRFDSDDDGVRPYGDGSIDDMRVMETELLVEMISPASKNFLAKFSQFYGVKSSFESVIYFAR